MAGQACETRPDGRGRGEAEVSTGYLSQQPAQILMLFLVFRPAVFRKASFSTFASVKRSQSFSAPSQTSRPVPRRSLAWRCFFAGLSRLDPCLSSLAAAAQANHKTRSQPLASLAEKTNFHSSRDVVARRRCDLALHAVARRPRWPWHVDALRVTAEPKKKLRSRLLGPLRNEAKFADCRLPGPREQ
jgi:hypothetical protein